VSVDNLAAKIAETETFAGAVADAANEANGEILGMITAIHLSANQHMAMADEYGSAEYTNGEKSRYTYGYDNFDHELTFVYTVEQGIYDAQGQELKAETWNFPEKYIRDDIDNTKGYKTPASVEGAADATFDFKDGRYRSYEDSILVRVSPTNADLRKAEIALLNSKGEDIIDAGLIELVDVEKYTRDGYITRAAAGNETGLWVIKFKLNDDNVGDLWAKYATYNTRPIVYAVAVKNTGISVSEEGDITSDGVDRYVVSEYDLSLNTEAANHAWNFDVNNTIVSKIHNRYIETEEGQGGSTTWTDDPERNTFRYELTWKTPCIPDPVDDPTAGDDDDEEAENPWYFRYGCACWFRPSGQLIDDCDAEESEYGVGFEGYTYTYFDKTRDGYEANKPDPYCYSDLNSIDRKNHVFSDTGRRQSDGVDNRHLQPFLEIDFDHQMDGAMWAKIDIEFPASVCGVMTPIRGFFVTLDQQFALESDNSEINAWTNYEYKNVGYYSVNHGQKDGRYDVAPTLFKGNKGTIYIKDANNIMSGDVLGFRVHAVNLDGTLFDPDGRAFYVKFGKQETHHQLSFNITPESATEDAWAVQDLVDGKNPIKAFNDEQKANNSDVRFFMRDAYAGSFNPTQAYTIEYTWREDNPAIRGAGNSDIAYIPEAGSAYYATFANGGSSNYWVRNFFDFQFSENADATIDDETDDVDNEWTNFNDYYSNNQKVAANRLTQSVKARIKAGVADRLIDGATYKITATIYRNDYQTGRQIVNIIDIDITKNMPTAMPKAFGVKSNQLANGAWTFYLRPIVDNATTAAATDPWKITWKDYTKYAQAWIKGADDDKKAEAFAKGFNGDLEYDEDGESTEVTALFHNYRWGVDARPYNFEGMFNGLFVDEEQGDGSVKPVIDQNYYFVFEGAGDYNAANTAGGTADDDDEYKDADALVVYNTAYTYDATNPATLGHATGAYNLPAIHWSHLNGTANVKAGYIYRNISANLNEDGTAFLVPNGTKSSTFGTSVKNRDYVLPEPVQVTSGTAPVVATFKCAFDAAVYGAFAQALETSTYEYNDDPVIKADSALFALSSVQWIAGDEAQAYFNGKFSIPTDIRKDKDNKATTKDADVKNAKTLAEMLNADYLWVDTTSLKAVISAPAGYVLSDYYYAPYWSDETGAQKGFANLTNGLFIGMKRNARTEGLPDFREDVEGKFKFDVYDVWFHKRTVEIAFKIKKPTNTTARRGR